MLKPFFFVWGGGGDGVEEIDQGCTECMQGILLVLGRRSKNKRWGGSGLAFID